MLLRDRTLAWFAAAAGLAHAAVGAMGAAWEAAWGLPAVRALSLLAGLLASGGVLTGGRPAPRRPLVLPLGAAVALALGLAGAWRPAAAPVIGLAVVATLLAAAAWASAENPPPSRLAMFRSQWQVPLLASAATYAAIMAGGYLKAMGSDLVCTTWPFCTGSVPPGIEGVLALHLLHRGAALAAGLALLYTAWFVLRRHHRRPLLLALAGGAIVLFGAQVRLGAESAASPPDPVTSASHLLVASAFMGLLVVLAVIGYYSPSLPAIAGAGADAVLPAARPLPAVAKDFFLLMKPRIVLLLLVTGFVGMWVAAGGMPPLGLTIATMLGLGLSCGAANAINMWFDRDIDAVMARTRNRPVPAGRLTGEQALAFGIMTGALAFFVLATAVNLLAACLSLLGLLYYVCVYTMWLKRTSDQNIVIGGVAGALPPVVGWAAVTGELGWPAWVMFLIVFVWTPPHFWALALFRGDEYARAGVPMLPVVRGERPAKRQILLYSLLLVPSGALLFFTGAVGKLYLWASVLLGLSMVAVSAGLLRERAPAMAWARGLFRWSMLYLALIFAFMAIDARGA